MTRFFILTLLLLLLSFNSTSYSSENLTSEKTNTSHETPTTRTNTVKQKSTDISSTINKTVSNVSGPLNPNNTENQEKEKNNYPDESWWHKLQTDPVATFTSLLFVATVLLWWSTRKLVRSTEQTAAQQMRAYVFTKHDATASGDPIKLEINGALSVSTIIKNFGNTPALDMMSFYSIRIVPLPLSSIGFLDKPSYATDSPKSPLAPGEVIYHRISLPTKLDKNDIAAIEWGTAALFVFGEIKYFDIFKQPHWTKYCLISTGDDFTNRSLAYYHEGNEAN